MGDSSHPKLAFKDNVNMGWQDGIVGTELL